MGRPRARPLLHLVRALSQIHLARARLATGPSPTSKALLPSIAAMGFDVLYLPPIHPIGTAFRKGRNNSVTSAPGRPRKPMGYRL